MNERTQQAIIEMNQTANPLTDLEPKDEVKDGVKGGLAISDEPTEEDIRKPSALTMKIRKPGK